MNSGRAKWSLPTFVLLVGLAAELYFLLGDVPIGRRPASTSAPTTQPIGELVTLRNGVKLQNEGELVWEEPAARQTLYRRQSLLTLDDSGAEVAFLDGTGLVIDEKSLILLERSPENDPNGFSRIVVRLLHGTIRKSTPRKTSDLLRRISAKTPKIEIATGDNRLELEPSSELTITARPENPEGARIVVQSGEVTASSPHGTVKIKQGEEASLPKEGTSSPKIRKLPFSLLSPSPGQAIEALGNEQPVRFRWNAMKEVVAGHPQEIEVSRDPSFSSSEVVKTRIPAAEPPLEYVEINVTLPTQREATRWYWRVHTMGFSTSPTEVSETGHFWIRPQPIPELRYPADHATAPALSSMDFSWDPFETATTYELEIDGRAPVFTKESFVRVEQMTPGTTHWRVRARLGDGGQTSWSASRELVIQAAIRAQPSAIPSATAVASPAPSPEPSIVASPSASGASAVDAAQTAPADDAPPPPAVLEEPEIQPAAPEPKPKHTQIFWDWLVSSVWAAEDEGEKWIVALKWKPVPGAKKYKVQISRERDFKSILTENEATKPEWNWDFHLGMQNEQGKAYFRVASVSAGGTVGTFSKPKPIKISKSILASAKYHGHAGPKEVYDARDTSEGAQPVASADAAETGDLESLKRSRVAVQSKDLIRPGTRAAPPLANKLHPSETEPRLSSEERLPPRVIERPSWQWQFEAALDTGYGSMSQTSGSADLSEVGLQAPYLQQKITILGELSKASESETSATSWLAEAQFWFAGFKAADKAPNPQQANVKTLGFRLDAYRSWANLADPWQVYFGLTLDRSFRWISAAAGQAVTASEALSLGPSARAVRPYHPSGPLFSLREVGLALDLPATGALTHGQAGAAFRIWGEWNLASLLRENALNLTLRAEGEGAYLHWIDPTATSTFTWTFWVAPALVF